MCLIETDITICRNVPSMYGTLSYQSSAHLPKKCPVSKFQFPRRTVPGDRRPQTHAMSRCIILWAGETSPLLCMPRRTFKIGAQVINENDRRKRWEMGKTTRDNFRDKSGRKGRNFRKNRTRDLWKRWDHDGQLCTVDDDDQNTDQSIRREDFSYATQKCLTKFLNEWVTSNCEVTTICGQNAYDGHPQLQIWLQAVYWIW